MATQVPKYILANGPDGKIERTLSLERAKFVTPNIIADKEFNCKQETRNCKQKLRPKVWLSSGCSSLKTSSALIN